MHMCIFLDAEDLALVFAVFLLIFLIKFTNLDVSIEESQWN